MTVHRQNGIANGITVRIPDPDSRKTAIAKRHFGFCRFDSQDHAFRCARLWRNAMVNNIYGDFEQSDIPCKRGRLPNTPLDKPHRNNKHSKIVGVCLVTGQKKGRSNPNPMWTANARIDGKTKTKSFSVALYGYDEAFKMAVAARKKLISGR